MADTLEIFGTEYTGVTGIIATTPNETDLTYIRPQGTKSITANRSGIDVVNYASVDVNVPSGQPNLQAKTNISPTTSSQTIQADSGYDGLSSVQINAMPSGTAGTPTITVGALARGERIISSSVTNTAGYIDGGTLDANSVVLDATSFASGSRTITENGTFGVVGLESVEVDVPSSSPTIQSLTVTPTTSQQTFNASGVDGYKPVTVNAMPTGTAGTPSASKGAVSNHSVSVTPSVTNTTGWITGSTKTGTAVTVSASELVSGSETKTENGTYDVTNLAELVVNVPSSGGASQTIYCGESAPSSSTGSNGDVYIITSGGGNLEAYPASFTSSGMNSTSNASACIGKSASAGSATGNMYSSGSGSTGVVEYAFDLSSIPSSATIDSVSCQVKAHEENASKSSMTLQLYAGNTAKGSATTVDGTSNTIYTLTTGTWTRSEIDSLVLHTTYGYYGGLVAGATLTIAYSMSEASYDVTLTGSSSGWSISGDGIYQKSSGSWSSVSSVTLESSIARG